MYQPGVVSVSMRDMDFLGAGVDLRTLPRFSFALEPVGVVSVAANDTLLRELTTRKRIF